MVKAYLGLGSNMGDKRAYLEEALRLIEAHEKVEVSKVSSFYETQPVGYIDQDLFMNLVVEVMTTLTPYELLALCNEVEEGLERKRIIRWGPRTIDVDVLLYDNLQIEEEKLTIPHPRMTERAFVMIPLYEINQDIFIKGKDIKRIMGNISAEGIKKIHP